MSVSVVWVDRDHAKLFHFSEDQMLRQSVTARRIQHHTHPKNQSELESPELYRDVCERLKESQSILLLGPGLARTHLLKWMEARMPALFHRVVGCEAVDHPSDPQIAAYAKRFFSQHHIMVS